MGSSFANARLRRTSVRFFSLGGGWLVPFSSGASVRDFQRQRKKGISPVAPRLLGIPARSVPVFVPSRSLTQKRGAAAFGARRSRFPNGSPIPLSRAEGLVRESSPNEG